MEFQGQPYLVAYDPILGPDGRAIGALYVGAPKSGFVSMLDVLVQGGLALGGLAALIVAAAVVLRHAPAAGAADPAERRDGPFRRRSA